MEEEFMALNFVKNNPFFKKDAEKRMSASFCGSMSLVSETVMVPDTSNVIRRHPYRGISIISSSRSKSAFSLAESSHSPSELSQPHTMVVEGTTVKLRRTDSTRRREMAARRETVEILMEEIVRENRKSEADIEAEERASSGSDLEYGPGIVEKLKAKFGRISTGSSKRRKNHKRHHSVDDILEESSGEYGTYDRRTSRQLTVPERSTQTLDRSPRHSHGSEQLSRRASRSMADLGLDEYGGDRRAFSLQRPSRREEYERQQEERLEHRLSAEEEDDEDMVDIRELRKMFDRPGGQGMTPTPAPWRNEARRERFIERGRTHQTVPPNLGDSRRDAPPPRELRLSAPAAPITLDHEADGEYAPARAVPLKKAAPRRASEREERLVFEEESEAEPEFVRMARRLRRATMVDVARQEGVVAPPPPAATIEPLAIVTHATAPADPAPLSDAHLDSPPVGRRDSFTGGPSDVSPPPEEPKPPMRRPSSPDLTSDAGSRYSSLARSEKSDRSRSESTHVPYSDLSLPRSDYSTASKGSKRSVSTEGTGVRIGYGRSTSSERRPTTYAKLVPENQEASGVEEMQRLLHKFNARKPRGEEEREAPPADAQLLAAREARGGGEGREGLQILQQLQPTPRRSTTTLVLSPEGERRTARFVPTVVGVRASDGRQLMSPTATNTSSLSSELLQAAAPAAGVVSISVRESAPSVIYTNNRRTSGSYDLLQHNLQPVQHLHLQQPCDEDDSDVRRSSVGSTASSTVSTSSMAESLTSSGCSSSEDLATAGEEQRPRSIAPPTTPPRKESLESSSSRKSLTARYLEERGREITVAAHHPEDESMMMEASYAELPFDRYSSTKPYGDEACMRPPTSAAPPVPTGGDHDDDTSTAPTVAKVEESPAAAAACCMSLLPDHTDSAPSGPAHLAGQEVTIVEIEEEEIIEEDDEGAAPALEARQQSVDEEETPFARQHHQETDSEIDTDDDGEIEDIANRHLRLCLDDMNSPLMAGDGNPLRHSLIHLAMEEDRPALLEAMSETYSFVFEDLDSERASTSTSIIKPLHKERCAKMKRISIATEVAGVYTYLDEQSAESEEEWRDGAAVTIEDYHSMVAAAAAEAEAAYVRSMDELARWKASIAASDSAGSSASSDPIADLTSRHLVFST